MKRKYNVIKTEVINHGLWVSIEVDDGPSSWGIRLVIPWSHIDQKGAYEAAERQHELLRARAIAEQLAGETTLF